MASIKKKSQTRGKQLQTPPAPIPEGFESQIEYDKVDTTSFLVNLNNIPMRDAAAIYSYDILWSMPGYGVANDAKAARTVAEHGIVCDLKTSHYTFTNTSPETLYLRAQRPMGYEASPSSLGMWEPLTVGGNSALVVAVKPHSRLNFHFTNGRTSLMVPRQTLVKGESVVHLLSFNVTREPLSDVGVDVRAGAGTGFQLDISTKYRANDGKVGADERYWVESYSGSSRMDELNAGPPSTMRIADIRAPGGGIVALQIEVGTRNLLAKFVTKNFSSIERPDGVDEETIYQLPNSLQCAAIKDSKLFCIAFNKNKRYTSNFGEVWVVGQIWCQSATTGYSWAFKACPSQPDASSYFPPNTMLNPVLDAEQTAIVLRRYGKSPKKFLAANRVEGRRLYSLHTDAGFLTTLLNTVVVISKVVKVGLEIVGMVGLMAVPLPSTPQSLAQSAGRRKEDADGCFVIVASDGE